MKHLLLLLLALPALVGAQTIKSHVFNNGNGHHKVAYNAQYREIEDPIPWLNPTNRVDSEMTLDGDQITINGVEYNIEGNLDTTVFDDVEYNTFLRRESDGTYVEHGTFRYSGIHHYYDLPNGYRIDVPRNRREHRIVMVDRRNMSRAFELNTSEVIDGGSGFNSNDNEKYWWYYVSQNTAINHEIRVRETNASFLRETVRIRDFGVRDIVRGSEAKFFHETLGIDASAVRELFNNPPSTFSAPNADQSAFFTSVEQAFRRLYGEINNTNRRLSQSPVVFRLNPHLDDRTVAAGGAPFSCNNGVLSSGRVNLSARYLGRGRSGEGIRSMGGIYVLIFHEMVHALMDRDHAPGEFKLMSDPVPAGQNIHRFIPYITGAFQYTDGAPDTTCP